MLPLGRWRKGTVMSKRNGRPPLWRALCLALSFVLALSMVPSVGLVGVQTALAADGVSYQKATVSGTTVTFSSDTAASCISLANGQYSLDAGWYVVEGEVAIDEPVTTAEGVNLILSDGATVTFEEGITLGGKLTVYGQTNGTGKLIANGRGGYAGIGAASSASGASLEIHGGMVVATGGTAQFFQGGAGIGGSNGQKGFPVIVYGGNVTATGGASAAGIGGGAFADAYDSDNTLLTVYGGNVMATGGHSAAGIGGGRYSKGGDVAINGGTVTANGGFLAQGIGRGRDSGDNSPSWQPTLDSGTLTVGSGMKVYGSNSQDPMSQIEPAGQRYQYMYVSQSEMQTYDLWVGLTQVNDLNRNSLATNHWSFTPSSDSDKLGTLTLSGYDNDGRYHPVDASGSSEPFGAAIYCGTADKELTIVLEGTNNLTQESGGQTPRPGYAIYAAGDLTIEGTGSLAATASSYAICVEDELDIYGGTITAIGAGTINSALGNGYGGIYADDVTIEGNAVVNAEAAAIDGSQKGTGLKAGSTLTVNGGTTTAKGAYGVDVQALYANEGSITADGTTYGISGWMIDIENGIDGFLAVGGQNAIYPDGVNVKLGVGLSGQAWDNTEGSSSGEGFNLNNLSSYKRAQFPSSVHFHHFTYEAGSGENSATITATCSGLDCNLTEGHASVTIEAPACTTYGDGKNVNATVTGDTDILGMPTITYEKKINDTDYEPLSDAPSDAGDYKASITLGEAPNSATANLTYTIARRPVTIKANNQTIKDNDPIAQGPAQVEVVDEFLLAGHTITDAILKVEANNNKKEIVIEEGSVKISDGVKDVTPNYEISRQNGELTYATTFTPPTAKTDPAYNPNKTWALVEEGTVTGAGTMEYAVDTDGSTAPESGWSGVIPVRKDAGTYYVWYRVVNDTGVVGGPAYVSVTIAKADPTANATASATYGQTLADATITPGENTTPGTWTWVSPTTSVGNVTGSNAPASFLANFTPDDTLNYNSLTNQDVSVTVSKANNPTTVTGTATVKKGNSIDLSSNVAKNGAAGTVSYSFPGSTPTGCSLDSSGKLTTSSNSPDSVTVNVSVAGDGNYKALAATPITVTLVEKASQTITAADVYATFGDNNKSVVASVSNPTSGGGAISYKVKEGSEELISVDAAGKLTIKNAGIAYVTATAAATSDYNEATKDVKVTISKAKITEYTAPTPNMNLVYSPSEQALVAEGSAVGGTMWYALGNNGGPTSAWSTEVPKATDAATYYVWYKVVGDENHVDNPGGYLPVSIAKADPKVTAPDPIPATYGQTLADLTLTNPTGNLDGTWKWVSPDTSVGDVQSDPYSYPAVFTPTDTQNYNSVSKNVSVTVKQAANPANIDTTATVKKGTTGNTVYLSNNVTLNGATGKVSYQFDARWTAIRAYLRLAKTVYWAL